MRFQVPQFIEIEDRIFGPLSFKQFIYVVGGGGIIVLLFFYLPNFLAAILGIPVGVFAAALAFYKVNKRPFIITVEAAFKHFFRNKIYVWKKDSGQGYFSESTLAPSEGHAPSSLKDKTFLLGMDKGIDPTSKQAPLKRKEKEGDSQKNE